MIDRRTYLAGQAMAGAFASPVFLGHQSKDMVSKDFVESVDALLAELQRTCAHDYNSGVPKYADHGRQEGYHLFPECKRCGQEKPE